MGSICRADWGSIGDDGIMTERAGDSSIEETVNSY